MIYRLPMPVPQQTTATKICLAMSENARRIAEIYVIAQTLMIYEHATVIVELYTMSFRIRETWLRYCIP